MGEFHGKVDLVQIEYTKAKAKAMPTIEMVTAEVMKQYAVASKAAAPYLTTVNEKLEKPLKDFASKFPAHAALLTAESLVDKVLLLSWLILAMTICLRILNICLGIV